MDIEVGTVHAGKVTGITKFGAFVTIAPGKSGLVHISEISGSYVNEVRDYLSEGQDVTVKVLGIDQSGRLNLSIIAALNSRADEFRRHSSKQKPQTQNSSNQQLSSEQPQAAERDLYFEDQLKRFMQDSNNRISGLKIYSEKKNSRRRSR